MWGVLTIHFPKMIMDFPWFMLVYLSMVYNGMDDFGVPHFRKPPFVKSSRKAWIIHASTRDSWGSTQWALLRARDLTPTRGHVESTRKMGKEKGPELPLHVDMQYYTDTQKYPLHIQ